MKQLSTVAILLCLVFFVTAAPAASVECFQTHPHIWHDAPKQPLFTISMVNFPAGKELTAVEVMIKTNLSAEQMPRLHLVTSGKDCACIFENANDVLTPGEKPGTFTGNVSIPEGTSYFWVLGDFVSAKPGGKVDIALKSVTISGSTLGSTQVKNASPAGSATVEPTDIRVYGYQRASMMIWNKDKPPKELFDYLTDIAFCGVGADKDGSLYFEKLPEAKEGRESQSAFIRELRRLLSLRGNRKVRIHLMIPKPPGIVEMAADPRKRERFARETVQFLKRYSLNGIDIDWEYPENAQEWANHTALLFDLRRAFYQHGFYLTAAGGSWKPIKGAGLALLDWINIMSYDHGGQHATFESFVGDINCYKNFGAAAWRITIGVPFYTHQTSNRNWDAAQPYSRVLNDQPDISIDQNTFTIDGKEHYFNGFSMIRRKAEYVKNQGLGGIMIWSLVHDVHPSHEKSLIRALSEGLK